MTVYQLIQELASFNPDTEVKFGAKFEYRTVGSGAEIKIDFDEELDLDELRQTAQNEMTIKLTY